MRHPPSRKTRKSIYFAGSWISSLARPLDEVCIASNEDRAEAIQIAQEVQQILQSSYPTFVKSMTPNLAYISYNLAFPRLFCDIHLPFKNLDMMLEDEKGKEYEVALVGKFLGCGWKSFALEHKLDDGDALVFELIEPTRFKVYIVRVSCQRGGKIEKDEMKDEDSKLMVKLKVELQQDSKDECNMPKKSKIEAVRRSTRSTRSSSK